MHRACDPFNSSSTANDPIAQETRPARLRQRARPHRGRDVDSLTIHSHRALPVALAPLTQMPCVAEQAWRSLSFFA